MKTALDPRHQKRQKLIEDLFKIEFHKQAVNSQTKEILEKKDFIDKKIAKAAPQYPIDKINKIDLSRSHFRNKTENKTKIMRYTISSHGII